jgi:hypothetical protein
MKKPNLIIILLAFCFYMGCSNGNNTNTLSSQDTLKNSIDQRMVIKGPSPEIDSLVSLINEEIKAIPEKYFPSKYFESTDEYKTIYYFNKNKEPVLIIFEGYEWTTAFYLRNDKLLLIEESMSDGEEPFQSKKYFVKNKVFEYFEGEITEIDPKTLVNFEKMLKKAKSELSSARSYPSGTANKVGFEGKYVWESNIKKEGQPEAIFNLFLENDGEQIKGGYDSYSDFGNKTEGEKGSYACKAEGIVFTDMVYLKLTNCQNNEEFMAFLIYNNGKYIFKTLRDDINSICPLHAVLAKSE